MQDIALKRRHVLEFRPFGVIEIGQGAQQITDRVAQLAIGIDGGPQDGRADALVFEIVGERGP